MTNLRFIELLYILLFDLLIILASVLPKLWSATTSFVYITILPTAFRLSDDVQQCFLFLFISLLIYSLRAPQIFVYRKITHTQPKNVRLNFLILAVKYIVSAFGYLALTFQAAYYLAPIFENDNDYRYYGTQFQAVQLVGIIFHSMFFVLCVSEILLKPWIVRKNFRARRTGSWNPDQALQKSLTSVEIPPGGIHVKPFLTSKFPVTLAGMFSRREVFLDEKLLKVCEPEEIVALVGKTLNDWRYGFCQHIFITTMVYFTCS